MDTEFQRVWNRVKAAGSTDDAAVLRGFIRGELQDAAEYTRLAGKTGAMRVRRLLAGLAAEERRHAKRLQAASFMLFGGNTASIARAPKDEERILGALRRRYARERESTEAYGAAAQATANETLQNLYRDLSAEERKHAEALCALLEEML